MRLEDGKRYIDGWGEERWCAGLTADSTFTDRRCVVIEGERVFWTVQGDWYTESGRATTYRPERGHILRTPKGRSNYDLVEVLPGSSWR